MCPAGWHVPSDAEWHVMEMTLVPNPGTDAECPAARTTSANCPLVGDKLKMGGIANFNGNFVGIRDNIGVYGGYGVSVVWWTSTSNYYRTVNNTVTGLGRNQYGNNAGISVRCLKN